MLATPSGNVHERHTAVGEAARIDDQRSGQVTTALCLPSAGSSLLVRAPGVSPPAWCAGGETGQPPFSSSHASRPSKVYMPDERLMTAGGPAEPDRVRRARRAVRISSRMCFRTDQGRLRRAPR